MSAFCLGSFTVLGYQIHGHEEEDRNIPNDETQTSDCVGNKQRAVFYSNSKKTNPCSGPDVYSKHFDILVAAFIKICARVIIGLC